MFGWDDDTRDADQSNTRRLASGIANNQPHLLPKRLPEAQEAAILARHLGAQERFRAVGLAPEAVAELEKMYRKMAVAFFYRHTGTILPGSAAISAAVDWNSRLRPIEHAIALFKRFPRAVRPVRNGRDFLGQFIYSWDISSDAAIFGFAAKFSSAALGMAVCYLRPGDIPLEEHASARLFLPNGDPYQAA